MGLVRGGVTEGILQRPPVRREGRRGGWRRSSPAVASERRNGGRRTRPWRSDWCAKRLRWREVDLALQPKGHPLKVELARQLRTQTPMSRRWIAQRLRMGSVSYVSNSFPVSIVSSHRISPFNLRVTSSTGNRMDELIARRAIDQLRAPPIPSTLLAELHQDHVNAEESLTVFAQH